MSVFKKLQWVEKIKNDLNELGKKNLFSHDQESLLEEFSQACENFSKNRLVKTFFSQKITFPESSSLEISEIGSENSLVFVDGYFSPKNSNIPSTIKVMQPKIRPSKFLQETELTFSSFISDLFCQEALEIFFEKSLEQPLEILFYFTPASQNVFVMPKLHFWLKQGVRAKVEILSHFVEKFSLTFAPSCELTLENGAHLTFENHPTYPAGVLLQELFGARLEKEAQLSFLESFISIPSFWYKQVGIFLMGAKSTAKYFSKNHYVSRTEKEVLIDIKHIGAETMSQIENKEALEGKNSSKFFGQVVLKSSAKNSKAYLGHHALLLSKNASALAKPFLKIFTNEAEAYHALTIANLSEEELFYLQSKGIDKKVAQKLLCEGFLKEKVDLS